jgi:glycosyltransferase involved in cell wall biosynthesis
VSPKISAIVITLNEGSRLRSTVDHLEATLPDNSEIIVVDDGSTDGSADFLETRAAQYLRADRLGVSRARNFGAAHAGGEILVFLDAHMSMDSGWWGPIMELLRDPSVGAVSPAIADVEEPECKGFGLCLTGPELMVNWLRPQGSRPYPVPLLPGACFAIRRDTFALAGGFDDGMIRWATEDTELSLRLWLLGYQLYLVPEIEVIHVFRQERPFTVEWSWVLHNRLRMAFVHFNIARISRVVEALRQHDDFAPGLALAVESDAFIRRRELASRRVHDAEWFFEKFGPVW